MDDSKGKETIYTFITPLGDQPEFGVFSPD